MVTREETMQVNEATPAYRATATSPDVPPGYKRTEVGVIPEDWEVVNLGSLGSFLKGKGIKRDEITRDGIPCIRYGELYTLYDNYVYDPIAKIPQTLAHTSQALETGDLLFTASGETRAEIGKCVAYLGQGTAFAGGDIIILRPVNQESLYLGHLLNYSFVSEQKARFGQGDAVVHIGARSLAQIELPLPPLAEQRAIAEALSDVDGLIGALDGLIAKKRAIKQAAMQQLLTGQTRLPGFTAPWETKLLGEVAEIDPENLPGTTPADYQFNYISLEQVDRGRLLGYTPVVFSTAPSRARRILRSGDVLISTVRPNLMAHLLFTNQIPLAVCSTGFSVIRAKKQFAVPAFLFAHLFAHPVNHQIERLIAGSNYPAINSQDVQCLEILLPPSLDEQRAIAEVLSDMDAEIAALEARRDKTKQIKQGMMQQLLTGRIRLVKPETAA